MADTDRIGETLRKRVLQDGIDFLGQEGRVNGILADMFPDLKMDPNGNGKRNRKNLLPNCIQ